MNRLFLPMLLTGLSAWCSAVKAQPNASGVANPVCLSVEFQAYPTGLIPGVRLEYGFNRHHSLHLRAGYNWVRHRDLGVQDHEQGDGFGGTLGYRYYFHNTWTGWFLGARSDVWRNTIDWQDKDDNGMVLSRGVSKILVVQPSVEGGYRFALGKNGWFVEPTLAFGVEMNVKTEGEPVGEGTIILVGVQVGNRF